MKSDFKKIIEKWIPQSTKVLDLGCGDGELLEHLKDSKNVNGFGIEIDISKANECLRRNIPVMQFDIDEGIKEFDDLDFDITIMANSIQCLKNPNLALQNILNISNRCIVTLPNFAHWSCRLDLFLGKMPVTKNLPVPWYETKNIHLCTIKDFEELCYKLDLSVIEKLYLNHNFKESPLTKLLPNLFAAEGVYLIERK